MINLAGFEAARSYTGLTSIAEGSAFRPAVVTTILVAWVLVPLGLALLRFRRRTT